MMRFNKISRHVSKTAAVEKKLVVWRIACSTCDDGIGVGRLDRNIISKWWSNVTVPAGSSAGRVLVSESESE